MPRFLLEWEQEEKKCWNWINSNNFFFFLNICVYFYFGLRQCILISMFGFPIWHDLHSENMCVVSIADHVCVRVCEWLALDLNESRQLLYSIVYELPTTRRIWILCYFCFPYEWIKYQNDSIDSATFATFQKYVCAILRLPLSPHLVLAYFIWNASNNASIFHGSNNAFSLSLPMIYAALQQSRRALLGTIQQNTLTFKWNAPHWRKLLHFRRLQVYYSRKHGTAEIHMYTWDR